MTKKTLHAGLLYWPTTLPAVQAYEPLGLQDAEFDVVIVGGGMSGTLCGYVLANSGIRAAVVERDDIASGSSSANTGLIQFSNDIMMCELADQIGEPNAVAFYKACKQAVEQLALLANRLPADLEFKRRPSLYLASTEQDLPKLRREFELLQKHGFDVDWWTPDDIRAHFPFTKSGAIVARGDAEVNPYKLVHALADAAVQEGLTIYEHTGVQQHITKDGIHRLSTAEGGELRAKHVIFAIGYEPEELRGQFIKATMNQSFVIVTQPQASSFDVWHERFMIWETARPYLYLRTDSNNRIIVGGLDQKGMVPLSSDVPRQAQIGKLYKQLLALFPTMSAPIDYAWCATFGESRDNLPFIGKDPARENVYYSLGYGGNGIVYSLIAARLLRDLINGEQPPLADIVRLDRPSLQALT
ncbi:NAD(P)/FAD-dependent oxidoreductase [Paenibacillus sp. MMS18-CY102]|uniref:NAD(P)/FAD-dependent oxidoreductase n=1 Tax=Paenibacillus sp. MMS18-CY102 TaxID=2682849 RepID=UPI001366002B|nr:FAD-dependent oxidoreductase [Paenibacillus sp. MMS18-CY102]MWC30055.1 FAD-dependent oxidoreductase [Paenibacillus sp. MMS18-CY102]